jgi:hypothetical protein
MRRGLLLGFVIVFTLALAAPVQAKTGPRNSWTQMENTWPQSGSPNCNPCVKWPNYFYSGTWHYGMAGDDFFHKQAIAATDDWSAQPYPSPILDEGARGCGYDNMCVSAASLPSGYCGVANDVHDSHNYITYGLVRLNLNRYYSDGPSVNGSCDVRSNYRHEIGHVWSEGHSAIGTDLMYFAQNKQEKIDADAQAELKAVYGTINNNPSGCSASLDAGINVCPSVVLALKQKLAREAESLSAPSLDFGSPVAL